MFENGDMLFNDAAGGLGRVKVDGLVAGERGGDVVGTLAERHLEMFRCWN